MISNNTCVYLIQSPSFKIYVGQTKDLYKRTKDYRNYKNIDKQRRLKNSFEYYGFNTHTITILKDCKDKNELNYWESFYIKLFDSFNTEHGLNLTSGGDCKFEVSEETKQKLRNANLGKRQSEETKRKKREISLEKGIKPPTPIWTEEKRKKWSEISSGSKNGNFGKEMKAHVKEALLQANLNKRLSEKQKENVSNRFKNIAKSESHKIKISQANKGIKRKKYKIICIHNGNIFNTLKDAAKFENRSITIVKDMLLGKRENITNLRIYA